MAKYCSDKTEPKFGIPPQPVDGNLYKNALLRILGRIDIESNDHQLKEDLKIIYQLLSSTGSNEPTDLLKPQIQKNENIQYHNNQTS